MRWFNHLPEAQLRLAKTRPLAFLLAQAWQFASGFALISLVEAALPPLWPTRSTPGHVLFDAVFGGVLGGGVVLLIARRFGTVASDPHEKVLKT
jgi:hypothetical protein